MFLASFAAPAMAESFNNESVIALANAGVGDDVLLAKINSLPCAYNVSTDEIIRLRKSGVSSLVIAAMVSRCTGASAAQGAGVATSDPSIKRSPGLYINLGLNGATETHVIGNYPLASG